MTKTTRRAFLQTAASAAVVTPYIFSSAQPVRAQAPSDRLQFGFIGVGSMGKADNRGFLPFGDVVAVCDVDTSHMDEAAEKFFPRKNPDGSVTLPEKIKDYRKVLERKDIDTVCIVTTDHWHVKIAVEALQAGKHVFCQKPLTLTVEEGQLIRAACKKYNKQVFQVGTQQRADFNRRFLDAVILIHKGIIGDVKSMVCHIDGSPGCDPIPAAKCPDTLDWDAWLGQAPMTEYIASEAMGGERDKLPWPRNSRTHYEYRWWYEYSGGKFTDWGAHHVDIALWATHQTGPGQGPVKFKPVIAEHPVPFEKGYPTVSNRYNTATKFDIECTFPNGMTMDIISHRMPEKGWNDGNGILFVGTKGKIHVSRGHINGKPIEEIKDKWKEWITEEDYVKALNGKKPDMRERDWHKANFVQCIKEGGLPVSDVFTHVQAMNVCHLAAIAARLNRDVTYDPKTETTGDAESNAFIARERRKGYDIEKAG
jgi:predicted dehydrogenase